MKQLIYLLSIGLFVSCIKPDPRFEQLNSEYSGIKFTNTITESDSFNILNNEYMYNGGGVGIGDLNNDGLQDIILTGNQVSTRIYLNLGDLKFSDISSNFDQLSDEQWHSGVAVVDINHDDLLDVYLTSTTHKQPEKRKNRLWINQGLDAQGIPSFKEEAESYGIADEGYCVHAGFFDYDLDGDLDLYILNNIYGQQVPTNYRPKITDGSATNNDRLYENTGNGSFVDVTQKAGIVYEGFGLGLAFGDVNKDAYPDIYISNDYISNDLLYINQKDGTFQNHSPDYFSYQSKFSMGNDMADINNDGNPDLITLDMLPEKYSRKKQTIHGNSYYFYVNDDRYGYEHQYVRNMLHLHNGFQNGKMLPYSEVGQMMGVFQTEWSWSPLFADYDNDGDKDLLITNGFPKDLTDKDFTNYRAQVHGFVASDRQVISRIPIVRVSNYVYENTGDYTFVDQTKAWGLDQPSFSNGAAFVDLDNDGDLDYVVNNIDEEAFVYKNNSIEQDAASANYINIQLEGSEQNTMAIGAKVEIWSGSQYQFYEHFLSRGYISSVTPIIHFGLGSNSQIDSLKVSWPSGKSMTLLPDVGINQLLKIDEQEAQSLIQKPPSASQKKWLFSAQENALDYTHEETDYIDFFQSQRIIQHKFSQVGPCMAKGDIDNDGLEDLVIGASDVSPTMVFLQKKGGQFTQATFEGLTDEKVCTEADLILADIEGDGDNDLIAISGGYVNEDEGEYKHYIYENKEGKFTKKVLPIPAFPASVVRAFDFDHDGDLDIFVGARVKKGAFPEAENSFVLINEKGTFAASPVAGFDLGMVSDAIWSDYDGDGWEDILITREWNSLAILKNKEGQGFELTQPTALEDKHGFWSGLIAVDLDQDGDDDYIVGNLGENHRFTLSDAYPFRLYAIDMDQNGVIDPITTAFWKDDEGNMQEYPINYLDELSAQSTLFRKKFTSYTDFSYATIHEVFDTDSLPADAKYYVNTTSSFILWNEASKFRWERLPSVLQVAPIREMIVRDFDGDQRPDVLISGNDHTYDVSTGYYDANKGYILLNKAKEASVPFEILAPSQSGLLLQGQVSSLLYFEGDTAYLVAGINRGKVALFQHIQR